jgi:hypothetical protein
MRHERALRARFIPPVRYLDRSRARGQHPDKVDVPFVRRHLRATEIKARMNPTHPSRLAPLDKRDGRAYGTPLNSLTLVEAQEHL